MTAQNAEVGQPDTTLEDVAMRPPRGRQRLEVAGIVLLVLIVLAGATGFLGVHQSTVSSSRYGYGLTVYYPRVARAGLDVPFRIQVHHEGGFPQGITIAVSTSYFGMFESQGFFPDADTMRNDGRFVYFSYDKAVGNDFELMADTYVQPSAQLGRSAEIEVLENGVPVTSVHIHTWLLP